MDPAQQPLKKDEEKIPRIGRFRITRNRLNFLFGLLGYLIWLFAFFYARRHSTTFEIPVAVSLAGGLGAVTCISMGFLIVMRKLKRQKAGTLLYVLLVAVTLVIIYYVSGLFVKPILGP